MVRRRPIGFALLQLVAACVACACDKTPTPTPPAVAAKHDAASSEVIAQPHAIVRAEAWADDVRAYRWNEARHGLDALGEADKARPDIRYARAVVCAALKDDRCTIVALESLETTLPLLTERILELRAAALERSGSHEEAATTWSKRETPDNLARASMALEAAGADGRAAALAERAIATGRLSLDVEAELRVHRMRRRDDTYARQDAHWVFVRAPASKVASEATKRLLTSKRPPTQDDWLLRARALVEADELELALSALDHAAALRSGKNSPLTLCRERARAFARAEKHHVDAAVQFERCAKLAGAKEGADVYEGALALSQTEREEEAVQLYGNAHLRSPGAPWAPDALYRAGKLRLLYGPWERAERDFADLVRTYPTASEAREADVGRGLALLAGKQWRKARATFERLAADSYLPGLAPRAADLAGDAAWQDGDHDGALNLWRKVANETGLSWPGLVARARLRAHGGPLPPASLPPPANLPAVALPPPVDILHGAGLEDEAESALRPRESLLTAAAHGRETEALCGAYSQIGRGTRVLELSARVPPALVRGWPKNETQWAWACTYPRPYAQLVNEAATRAKIPAAWVYAILRQEGFVRLKAKDPRRGLMGPRISEQVETPAAEIEAGSRKLSELLRAHKSISAATTAFRAGSPAVRRWAEHTKAFTVDLDVEAIPDAETRNYVMNVLADIAAYTALEGGEWELGTTASP